MLPDGEFCLFCGDLLPETLGKSKTIADSPNPQAASGSVTQAHLEYAGFWLRVWAGLIDVVLEVLVALLLAWILKFAVTRIGSREGLSPITGSYFTGIGFILMLTIGSWLYCAFAESSNRRATLGKRIMGLQVVTSKGDRLNFGQASVRHFMKFLSLFTATVGFMMAGWTKRRQALHDMPTDSLVIRVAEPSLSLFGR